jgi:hypothetical protein
MMGGPRIKHVDDVPENEVLKIEFEDGRTASVRERFVEMLPNFLSFYNHWDPGMIQRKHGHHGHHVVFILSGSMMVGDELCTKGSHIFLMHGDTFGPWIAGPEGCETLGIVAGHGMSFCHPNDEAAFLELLADNGAKRAPVPPIDPDNLPAWRSAGYVGAVPAKVASPTMDSP